MRDAKELERLGDEIAEVAAHVNVRMHRLLSCIRVFDAEDGWSVQGALSCAHWLSWRIGLGLSSAREHVRVAKALGELALLDDALRMGHLSYSKVRALTRVATRENEADLLAIAKEATGAQLELICRRYGRALAAVSNEEREARRYLSYRETSAGTVRIEGELLPEEAEVVKKAIEAMRAAAVNPSAEGGRMTQMSRPDALVALAEQYLSAPSGETRPPVEIVVHVHEGHAELEDGTPLSDATTRRLSCDASIVKITEDADGSVLDVGRKTRRISTRLRRALKVRDKSCRFPSCTNRLFVDGHHIEHWTDGGKTSLTNTILLCRRHHRFVHEQGYRIEIVEPGEFRFFDAKGALVEAVPKPQAVTPDLETALDAEALFAPWNDEPVDYASVIDALMPAAGDPH